MDRAVVLVGEPISCRPVGGMVRFEIRTGNREIQFAISFNNFLASFARAAAVAREWQGGEVVNIASSG